MSRALLVLALLFPQALFRSQNVTVASGGGTVALIQALAVSLGSGGGTSSSIDTTGANAIYVAISYLTSATLTVSDNKGNTYTPLTEYSADAGGAGSTSPFVRIYYATNATVGTGHTWTCTGTAQFIGLAVGAFSNLLTSSIFDSGTDHGNGVTAGTTLKPGSTSPSSGQKLVITATSESSGPTVSIDSSFVIVGGVATGGGSNFGVYMYYIVQANGTTVDPQWSYTIASNSASGIAAFKGQ